MLLNISYFLIIFPPHTHACTGLLEITTSNGGMETCLRGDECTIQTTEHSVFLEPVIKHTGGKLLCFRFTISLSLSKLRRRVCDSAQLYWGLNRNPFNSQIFKPQLGWLRLEKTLLSYKACLCSYTGLTICLNWCNFVGTCGGMHCLNQMPEEISKEHATAH